MKQNFPGLVLFISERRICVEARVPLIQPIAVLVGNNRNPSASIVDSTGAAKAPDDIEFLLAIQTVPNVMEQDTTLFRGVRVFDEHGDRDASHAALSEYVLALARASAR